MSSPKVCIIMLNWNGLADTLECLDSLRGLDYPDYKVIVVDNASRGDDVYVLRQKFSDYVHVIQNDLNYGFAGGNNIGIRYALDNCRPDYLFLLNNDTVVGREAVTELVRVGEAESAIGVIGPKIYYYNMSGRKDIIWSAGGMIRWWHPWVYGAIGFGEEDGPAFQEIKAVPWVSGAAIMIKRQVMEKLGLLDVGYFSGNEDVDYCLKARRKGFKVVCVPTSLIWHKVGRARPHPTGVTRGVLAEQGGKRRRGRGPRFADLPPYYRLLRRNLPAPVLAYHVLISPIMLLHRTFFWLRGALGGLHARNSQQAAPNFQIRNPK